MDRPYQICSRCIMDTSDPEIQFDENGWCKHCRDALKRIEAQLLPPREREAALAQLVARIKSEGRGRDYDCIVGLSGGVDSTMTAYTARKLGLRPLAVHFDNGWNSELAVDNIKKALEHLGIDLYTHVVDWEEFRDLQLSFLRASVANCEIPTDHGITATLFRAARREGVHFILSGSNLATESIMPISWGHYNQDLKHLKAIHRRFGTTPLRTMPTLSLADYVYLVFFMGIRQIPFLNYIAYNKREAKEMLASEVGWRDYGGKHYESVWTRFFQGYYLPQKFGFDKRRAHLSSMIVSNSISREEALAEMRDPVYPKELLAEDMQFVIKKFGLTRESFEAIMSNPGRPHTDFPSHYFLFHRMRSLKNAFRRFATTA